MPPIQIELTQGNLDHQHIYLAKHRDFFPADAIGASSSAEGCQYGQPGYPPAGWPGTGPPA